MCLQSRQRLVSTPPLFKTVESPSTSPATPTAIYGGSSRPKTVVTAGRTSVRTVPGASTPTRGRSGSSGSVFNWSGPAYEKLLEQGRAADVIAVFSTECSERAIGKADGIAYRVREASATSHALLHREAESTGPRLIIGFCKASITKRYFSIMHRVSNSHCLRAALTRRLQTVQRLIGTTHPPTVVRSTKSTYVLPRELKEELARKKRRERELQLQREAREESERRQRALEAEQAFRAWLAKKRREGSLTRTDNSVSRDETARANGNRKIDNTSRCQNLSYLTKRQVPSLSPMPFAHAYFMLQRRILRGANLRVPRTQDGRHPSGAYEAWLRRKQRQQREEELRRRLRQLDVAATEKPRRSRQEAQKVYLAWLERKYEEERQRRLATLAERRGAREAALSASSLRILEQYLRSEEFSRYPELVV
ncbi:hypothetical protein HPB51_024147 [Rhipicephalus microplus]|uniref:Coiled-coil domain-containing protein 181 n=1 Tax=Rhipicephalus microplus TaxID=6941 RepID=A0A9J6DKN3_RHIMP|nr:hypothetical protein HPB51_024147 [Rhipicephalus microplus]